MSIQAPNPQNCHSEFISESPASAKATAGKLAFEAMELLARRNPKDVGGKQVQDDTSFSRHFLVIFLISIAVVFFSTALPIRAQEGIQFFQAQPPVLDRNKDRNLVSCFSGLRQFVSAGIGYESFKDYFRDFFLWPLHYVDVASIQNQVNKARYAVVAAFLRCDLNRLPIVTEAYYKLEAELYFIRNYVDTSGGFLHILTENFGERNKFANDLAKYMILRKASSDENKDRALFLGYFDMFHEKYKERAKSYKGFGDDPIYKELSKKFDELINTFKSFGKTSEKIADEGGDKEKKPPPKKPESGDAKTHNAPPKSIKEKTAAFLSKFIDACVNTSGYGVTGRDITRSSFSPTDSRYCLFGSSQPQEKPFEESGVKKISEKKTFEEVIIAVNKEQLKRTEDLTKAEMLTRYEVLYGEVAGPGIEEMLIKLEKLKKILGLGVDNIPTQGSLLPLKNINQCAKEVLKRQCS